ncbi:MAG: hypothetical protein P8Z30_01350 [Acidobacteriota bacterium]
MSIKFRLNRLTGIPAKFRTLNCGTRIRRGKLTAGLLLLSFVALMTIGCGGSSSNSSTTTNSAGALYTFVGDAPACDVLSFSMFPSQLDLHQAGEHVTG